MNTAEALKILDSFWNGAYWTGVTSREAQSINEAFAALTPLSSAEQQPVAWISEQYSPTPRGEKWFTVLTFEDSTNWDGFRNARPLYSAPQASQPDELQQWKNAAEYWKRQFEGLQAEASNSQPVALTAQAIYDLVAKHESPDGLWNGPKFTHEGILNLAHDLLSASGQVGRQWPVEQQPDGSILPVDPEDMVTSQPSAWNEAIEAAAKALREKAATCYPTARGGQQYFEQAAEIVSALRQQAPAVQEVPTCFGCDEPAIVNHDGSTEMCRACQDFAASHPAPAQTGEKTK